MASELTTRVVGRLETVLDPCSCMTGTPVNIVDMGLLERIEVEDGIVDIELVATSPMCLYMTQIIDEARAEILALEEVEEVRIEQNIEVLWRPDRMTDELLAARGGAFTGRDASNLS